MASASAARVTPRWVRRRLRRGPTSVRARAMAGACSMSSLHRLVPEMATKLVGIAPENARYGHERIDERRGGGRCGRGRAERRAGARKGAPPGHGGGRRGPAQRPGGAHAGFPLAGRDVPGGPAGDGARRGGRVRRAADRGPGRPHRARFHRAPHAAARCCGPAGCWWPPGCATSCPTSPASASGGAAICCTARTAMGTRSAISRSACSARTRARCIKRCCCEGGRTTSCSSGTPWT